MIYTANERTALGEQLEQITSTTSFEIQEARKEEACRAASRGSLYRLRSFLDEGDISVDDRSPLSGDTLLIAAVASWNIDKVSYLLDRGAKVDDQNIKGCSALMKAARHGSPSVVGTLLKRGARFDLLDEEGMTALMHAAYMGFPRVVALLLAYGADPNCVSHCGCTVSNHAMRGKQYFDEYLIWEEERLANGRGDPELYAFLKGPAGPDHKWVMRMLKQRIKTHKKAA